MTEPSPRRSDHEARNVEIKARIESVEAMTPRVAALADRGPTEIEQDDIFFACGRGRLKLRVFSASEGELIFYRRADQAGPKESRFVISRTESPGTLREALSLAYGAAGRVRKHRTLYLVGRTRVHLDRVEGLGDFLELEVVQADGESADAGVKEARALMTALGVTEAQLVETAYVDLLPRRDLIIRDARPADRDAIREVTLAAYQEYAARMPGFWEGYRQNIVESVGDVGAAEQLVAERHGTVVGTVLLYPPRRMKLPRGEWLEMPWPEVRLLAVVPDARGGGIGGALMQECMRRVRRAGGRVLSLHTTDLMETARRMYERMGFVRAPELDFHAAPGMTIKGYRLDLGEVEAAR
jgi:predicted adenylyl cyclase CyaB